MVIANVWDKNGDREVIYLGNDVEHLLKHLKAEGILESQIGCIYSLLRLSRRINGGLQEVDNRVIKKFIDSYVVDSDYLKRSYVSRHFILKKNKK